MFIDRAGIRDRLRLDAICGPTGFYKHIVPTGLKKPCSTVIYKHIVPTGLKTLPQRIWTLKLTLMGRGYLVPIRKDSSKRAGRPRPYK